MQLALAHQRDPAAILPNPPTTLRHTLPLFHALRRRSPPDVSPMLETPHSPPAQEFFSNLQQGKLGGRKTRAVTQAPAALTTSSSSSRRFRATSSPRSPAGAVADNPAGCRDNDFVDTRYDNGREGRRAEGLGHSVLQGPHIHAAWSRRTLRATAATLGVSSWEGMRERELVGSVADYFVLDSRRIDVVERNPGVGGSGQRGGQSCGSSRPTSQSRFVTTDGAMTRESIVNGGRVTSANNHVDRVRRDRILLFGNSPSQRWLTPATASFDGKRRYYGGRTGRSFELRRIGRRDELNRNPRRWPRRTTACCAQHSGSHVDASGIYPAQCDTNKRRAIDKVVGTKRTRVFGGCLQGAMPGMAALAHTDATGGSKSLPLVHERESGQNVLKKCFEKQNNEDNEKENVIDETPGERCRRIKREDTKSAADPSRCKFYEHLWRTPVAAKEYLGPSFNSELSPNESIASQEAVISSFKLPCCVTADGGKDRGYLKPSSGRGLQDKITDEKKETAASRISSAVEPAALSPRPPSTTPSHRYARGRRRASVRFSRHDRNQSLRPQQKTSEVAAARFGQSAQNIVILY